jgi:hypothetical protein
MERRGCSLGCILSALGLLLSACLLPYLLSSIYAIVTALLNVEGVPDWLWGDWIHSLVGDSSALYMILSEGPICCVGTLGLVITILGLVLTISGPGVPEEPYARQEEFYAEVEDEAEDEVEDEAEDEAEDQYEL